MFLHCRSHPLSANFFKLYHSQNFLTIGILPNSLVGYFLAGTGRRYLSVEGLIDSESGGYLFSLKDTLSFRTNIPLVECYVNSDLGVTFVRLLA